MKKVLLSLLTLFAFVTANAQVVFDFDNDYQTFFPDLKGVSSGSNDTYVADGEFATDQTVSKDGITLVFKASAEDAKTRNRVWASAPRLRMYNESFSVSAPGHKITKIAFKGHSSNFNISTETGTLEGKDWTGEAESVVFAVAKNTQINTITVTLDGKEDETPSIPEVDITNKPETAYTVTQALELIKKGEGLSAKVYVKGTISKVDEVSTEYGNATYYITDGTNELEVYRGFGLGGGKFTSEDDIQDGDEVIVYGKLVDYKGTPEFTTGSEIYSLNGKTKEDIPDTPVDPDDKYTVVGAGTLDNPYTTEDIIKGVYVEGETKEGIWVKGTILGCVNTSKGNTLSDKDAVASNIALGNADGTNIIPVQLVYVKEGDNRVREAVNVMENPDNIGKTVYVFGDVIKYCGVAGIKNTSNYSWDGTSTSIIAIDATALRAGIYNLAGQKLSAPQKGVNIIGGKKVVY